MKYLSESEIKNVSGGFIGGFAAAATKGVDVIGRFFTIKEMFNIVSDHFSQVNVKQVNDFKKDPSTVTDRFSFNGDL